MSVMIAIIPYHKEIPIIHGTNANYLVIESTGIVNQNKSSQVMQKMVFR